MSAYCFAFLFFAIAMSSPLVLPQDGSTGPGDLLRPEGEKGEQDLQEIKGDVRGIKQLKERLEKVEMVIADLKEFKKKH
jgi:hypothetical protein